MKVISIRKERILIFIYLFIIVIGLYTFHSREAISTFNMPVSKKVILLDAGHGGWDPGKVGGENTLEKDLNLKVAQKLQVFLEQGGSVVINTRVTDEALGDKKSSDMKNRAEISAQSKADILISIHQNAFTKENVKGAQVFYYNNSSNSKLLAENIQNHLKSFVQPDNNRVAKSNDSYYILKQTDIPAVIVECGFLSNPEEMINLSDEDYQEKIAWAIYMGIIDYYKALDKSMALIPQA